MNTTTTITIPATYNTTANAIYETAMSEQLDHVADTRHVITMSMPIQTQVEPDSDAPTTIYQVTTTPEPPNRGTCHVATPPEPEQADIEAKPAALQNDAMMRSWKWEV